MIIKVIPCDVMVLGKSSEKHSICIFSILLNLLRLILYKTNDLNDLVNSVLFQDGIKIMFFFLCLWCALN